MLVLWFAACLAAEAPANATVSPAPATATAPTEAVAPAKSVLDEAATLVEEGPNTVPVLQQAIDLYDRGLQDTAVPAPRRAKALIDVARAYLRLGDLTKGSDARVALYEKGRAAAQKASALSPKDADAVFWDTANFAMVADTRGVMNSLFAVPDIKKGFERALALDPNHAYARQTLAKVHHAIPGFVGGSDDHARAGLLEVLRRDPDFTPAMVALAVLCADRGEKDEARTWAKKALEAKRSTLPNDYKKFDVRDAKAVLARLEGK